MERSREQLLTLLRSNLWGTEPSAELFEGAVDWDSILSLARKQSVMGQVYSQIEQLPSAPSKGVMMQLHTLTTLNRKMQQRQLLCLQELCARFRAVGIERAVLLKGIGVSANYIDPGVRQCGDIDIYVGKQHYEAACSAAQSWSESTYDRKSKSLKHFHFSFGGIPVEIHRIAISSSKISRNSSSFDAWCCRALEGEGVREVEIEGVKVTLPPYNFDAIYIFFHAWSHFCTYGISFRQICDWARYLTVFQSEIDQQQLAKDIEYFGLTKPWGFFAALAVEHLGASPEVFATFDPSQQWHTEHVAARIWEGGNFGFYSNKNATGKNFGTLLRKTINFFSLFGSFAYLLRLDKRYALSYLYRTPLSSIKANIFALYYSLTAK